MSLAHAHAPLGELLLVTSLGELAWLVDQNDEPRGRQFVVAGAERLPFYVEPAEAGYRISRLGEEGVLHVAQADGIRGLADHTIGSALAVGLLFAVAVH